MSVLVVLLLLAIALVLVGKPFLRSETVEEDLGLADDTQEAQAERDRVFAALADVEYDHEMKKLSDADYKDLKAKLSRQAVRFLKEEEDLAVQSTIRPAGAGDGRSPDDEIEREIERELEREIEAESTGTGKPSQAHCIHCGAQLLSAGQRYCQACGGKLP